jgi:hypothetical protein
LCLSACAAPKRAEPSEAGAHRRLITLPPLAATKTRLVVAGRWGASVAAFLHQERIHHMSPSAGDLLIEHIAPRLRATIPKVVHPVGAEDDEELVQDAIVVAAQMLDSVERHGKAVTAGNIAYYAILAMKSGRRSQCRSRADVMAQGTQLDRHSIVLSFEEEVGYDAELDQAITLGELLATEREDPATAAACRLDWDQFLAGHDDRYGVIVRGMAEGRTAKAIAEKGCAGFSRIYQLQASLAEDLREFMGEEALADALRVPTWRGNLLADREKTACQADRRRDHPTALRRQTQDA